MMLNRTVPAAAEGLPKSDDAESLGDLARDTHLFALILCNLIDTEVSGNPREPGFTFALSEEQADMIGFAAVQVVAAARKCLEAA